MNVNMDGLRRPYVKALAIVTNLLLAASATGIFIDIAIKGLPSSSETLPVRTGSPSIGAGSR